jgi:hypothetical protein
VPSGDEILRQLKGMAFRYESAGKTPGPTESTKKDRKKKKKKKKKKKEKKKRKRKKSNKKKEPVASKILCKKKSILFRLPYWKDNLLRYNLDMMHIEKNVMNNILDTMLDIKGKTMDNV